MKKTLRVLMVALVATILASGSAFAASALYRNVTEGPTSGAAPYVFGSEWLAGQAGPISVDLGAAVMTPGDPGLAPVYDIQYIPEIDLGLNGTLLFVVANGAIDQTVGNVYYLFNDEGDTVATMIDYTNGSGGYDTLLFKMVVDSVGSGDVLTLSATDGEFNSPILVTTAALLNAGNVSISLPEAKDDTGTSLTAPTAGTITLSTKATQLSAELQSADSTIDVEEDRKEFTSGTQSGPAYISVIDYDVNQGIVVADASYTITLNSTQSAIDGVEFDGQDLVLADGVWSFTHTTDPEGEDNGAALNSEPMYVYVDGDIVIDPTSYTVDLTIDPLESGVADQNSLVNVTAFIWDINAMQAKVPYFILNAAGYSSFMKIVNESQNDAELAFDAIIFNFSDGVNEQPQTNVVLPAVPAYSNTTVSDTEVATALGLDPTKVYHVALTCVLVAPPNEVQISAYQKDAVGRTAIPVLYNLAAQRRWFQ